MLTSVDFLVILTLTWEFSSSIGICIVFHIEMITILFANKEAGRKEFVTSQIPPLSHVDYSTPLKRTEFELSKLTTYPSTVGMPPYTQELEYIF
ncbi:hypothetical protein CQ011_13585 [Arthrobacter sp. MYb213]|nr:hypothetical protein CQ011_13585 [Arthrobacter sp. MYb213]